MNAFSATASVSRFQRGVPLRVHRLEHVGLLELVLGESGEGGEREQRATPLRKRFQVPHAPRRCVRGGGVRVRLRAYLWRHRQTLSHVNNEGYSCKTDIT